MSGCLVNSLMLRLDGPPASSATSRSTTAAAVATALSEQRDLSYGDLTAAARGLGIDVPVAFISVDTVYELDPLGVPLEIHVGRARFPLSLTVLVSGTGLTGLLEVQDDVLELHRAVRLVDALTLALNA